MGLEELIGELERDGRERLDRELEAARAEAERRSGEAAARRERRRAEALAALDRELEAESAVALAEARRRARAGVLAAREAMLERVFDAARTRLGEAARSSAATGLFERTLEESLLVVAGSPIVVRVSPALEAFVRERLAGREDVRLDVDGSTGSGFVVAAADGSVEVDGTLEGRLARLAPRLRVEVLRADGSVP